MERGDEGERCTRRDSENRYERKGEKGRNENERRMSVHGDLSMRMGHGVEWRGCGEGMSEESGFRISKERSRCKTRLVEQPTHIELTL